MTIYTALKKIDTLTEGELKHCIQLTDIEINNYNITTKNYSQYNIERYAIPYMKILMERRQTFIDRLNQL